MGVEKKKKIILLGDLNGHITRNKGEITPTITESRVIMPQVKMV